MNLEYIKNSKKLTVKYSIEWGFPGGSASKESTCSADDLGSIPWSGRSCGEEKGNPLHYSCLENPMDLGGWLATVHEVVKSHTQLSTTHCEVNILSLYKS